VIDVLFVILPETLLLDLAGPAEAFRIANQRLRRRGLAPAFRLRFVGPQAQCGTSIGAALAAVEPLPAVLDSSSWVVLLGQPSGNESALAAPLPRAWTRTRRWLTQVVQPRLQDGARLVTVCAGALLAADAGLLAGRRCTTHHEMLADLQRIAPSAQVLGNRVFVEDGPVVSSAGITAGIDMALHLIAQTCGDAVAAAVAQTMVIYLRRGSDDPQLSPLLSGRNHLHAAVHRVQNAVGDDPARAWPLEAMAAVAHVTPRHLTRLFATHVGRTPRAYVEGIRVAQASRAIDAGAAPKQALSAAGFAGDRQWRRARQRAGEGQAQD
jgi:transcriptional regulator GlxA family with amidase domain